MASPPYGGATSPPAASPLALPRQRPALALPGAPLSRKPSIVSAASSAHPLRQTSFPPADSLEAQHMLAEDNHLAQYSPSADGSLDDFSDDNEIRSAISGPTGGVENGAGLKRKRKGEKRPIGRPPKKPRGNVVNGEEGRSQKRGGIAGANSMDRGGDDADAEGDDADEDDEADQAGAGGGRVPLYEGGQMTREEMTTEHKRKNAFYETMSNAHKERFDSWNKAKLRTGDVRRLVNQTLSQSVPQNVVLAVSAYVKLFAGSLIEEAREVQAEWTAVEGRCADGSANRAGRRLERSRVKVEIEEEAGDVIKVNGEMDGVVKNEPTSPAAQQITAPAVNGTTDTKASVKGEADDDDPPPLAAGGAGGLGLEIEEHNRGPLLPDHLREALRRYKKRRAGGPVGFTGLSLEGAQNTAPRMGGRRLFR
ncbi:hypothetical protein LTR78_000172 [Recurvomyces mirabilis]|uniref:TAFII28-like protein domain-containing protein n=1 Tax=Recurvomyces mirabilis TaxID=574656 RepID=A0AAE0WWM6_9PEZI|nr:hypothetical protein LTR78_000172 [Recurvomyces mirabilis]KAK5161829.1 hypothetical protein LTS14_000174 [Recurvomyces mirabilis]